MKIHTLTTKAFGAVVSLLFMGVSFGVASPAHAQATTPSQSYTCLTLAGNLTQGMSDMGSQGQVFQLQQFLNQAGDMSYAPTGYFGPLTYAAAVAFQSANGVPGTGYVGPLTRAAIQKVSCGSSMTDPSVSVSIDSVTPDSVAVGGVVTVTGRGFDTAADNMVFMAGGAVTNVYDAVGHRAALCRGRGVPDVCPAHNQRHIHAVCPRRCRNEQHGLDRGHGRTSDTPVKIYKRLH